MPDRRKAFEALIPTEPTEAQAPPRLSRAQQYEGGAEDPRAPACAQAQVAHRLAPAATLKQRSDFKRLKSAPKWVARSFVLHGAPRSMALKEHAGARFGFTVSRHAVSREAGQARGRGHAVLRNRARRRLKEAVRLVAHTHARDDYDYMVIARHEALVQKFQAMVGDLRLALDKVNRAEPAAPSVHGGRRSKRR
jgi:ribonuclease P protein component